MPHVAVFFLHTKTERSIEILFHCPKILKNSNSLIIDEAVKETINIVITLQLIWKYFFSKKVSMKFLSFMFGDRMLKIFISTKTWLKSSPEVVFL
jgi:hypothetical protein